MAISFGDGTSRCKVGPSKNETILSGCWMETSALQFVFRINHRPGTYRNRMLILIRVRVLVIRKTRSREATKEGEVK